MQRHSPEFQAQLHACGGEGAVIADPSTALGSACGFRSQNGLRPVNGGEEAPQGFDLWPLMDGDVRLPGIVVHVVLVVALCLIEGFPELNCRLNR